MDSTALGLEAVTHRTHEGVRTEGPAGNGTEDRERSGLHRKLFLLSLQAGPLQTNRVRATVAPLPMIPAPGRAPKMPAASKASSDVFFQPSMEEEEEEADEEYPSGP